MAKVKPNLAAERAVLGGLVQHGRDALYDVQDIITTNTFSDTINQVIYTCVSKCLEQSKSIDIPSILSTATQYGVYDIFTKTENSEYLKSLFKIPTKLENVRKLASKIKKIEIAGLMQKAIEDAHFDLSKVSGDESIDGILSILETPVYNLSNLLNDQNAEQPQRITDNAEEYVRHLLQNPVGQVGISSGFPIYDKVIGGGFRRGYVNLVVARPKAGKSTFAKDVTLHVTQQLNIPVLYLDTEMQKTDQLNRILASISGINIDSIETGHFAAKSNKILDWIKKNKNIPFFHKRIAGKPFDEVLSIIRRWLYKEVGFDENGISKPCLIIYDYFKLMDSASLDKMQEYQALGFQISKLSDFLGDHQATCLAFVQSNRDGIEKHTTDIVSQSDRLVWLCSSLCLLRKKTSIEIVNEGPNNGNTKIIPMDAMRFSGGLDDGDHINYQFDGEYSKLTEVNTKKQSLVTNKVNIGFELEDVS